MLALSALATVGLISLGFVVMITIIFVIAGRIAGKRTEALKALAAEMNFSFEDECDNSILEQLQHFYLFSRGHSPVIANMMRSQLDDVEVLAFDYFYTVNVGRQVQVVDQTVMLFRSEGLQLPSFILWPQNIFHTIGKSFGYQDIDFSSHPAFSNSYLLQGEDEERIRQAFNDKVLSYYQAHSRMSTEGSDGLLVYYRNAKAIPPKDMPSFIRDGFELMNLLK